MTDLEAIHARIRAKDLAVYGLFGAAKVIADRASMMVDPMATLRIALGKCEAEIAAADAKYEAAVNPREIVRQQLAASVEETK